MEISAGGNGVVYIAALDVLEGMIDLRESVVALVIAKHGFGSRTP